MRYIRDAFRSLIRISDSPERIAISFAVGVFLGFSPFLGLHTLLGLGVSVVFRLNKVATLLGAWTNVPWILVPFYSLATWLGVVLLGMPEGIYLPSIGLTDLFTRQFWNWLASQWRLLIPAFVGSTLLATLFAIAAYPTSLYLLRKFRSEHRALTDSESE